MGEVKINEFKLRLELGGAPSPSQRLLTGTTRDCVTVEL